MVFRKIIALKNELKMRMNKLYHNYGLLCATHPLPMISTSVIIVILCSLPICSLPVFERTATFLFGRITLENYQSNVSLVILPAKYPNYPIHYVQQVSFVIDVKAESSLQGKDTWILLNQFTQMQNLTQLLNVNVKGKKGGYLKDICMKTTRRPFYRSPHTRLLHPKGRFYRELKKWFPRKGCLITGPSVISGISERKRDGLHDSFKELVLGQKFNTTGISDSLLGKKHKFYFTYTFFLGEDSDRFISILKSKLENENVTVKQRLRNESFKITYSPIENGGPVELIPLTLTYLLVFVYLLFSVAKLDMLKSRWGLAFAAVMTIVLSLAMAVGICASFDAIPSTMTIKEIFPYLVIIIGLENILIVVKSVLSTPVTENVIVRVARGMEKEGWYMTRTVVVEMLILGAGYYTKIPSLREFCTFACVGVLSDFFLQLVFFTPILAVDIRRAELTDLQRVSFEEQFTRGFNLTPEFTSALSKRLRVLSYWARIRIIQRGFMVGCIVYISFVVYQQLHDKTILEQRIAENTTRVYLKSKTYQRKTQLPDSRLVEPPLERDIGHDYRCLGEDDKWNKTHHYSWQLLCKQHWLELFAFYHVPQHERSLLVLPQIDVNVNLHLTSKDLMYIDNLADKSNAIFIKGILVTTAVVVCLGTMFSLVWLCCIFCGKSRREKKEGCRASITRVSLAGHTHRIKLAVTTGTHVITCCLFGNIRVWDPVADQCLLHLDRRKQRSINCKFGDEHPSSVCDQEEVLTEYEQHHLETRQPQPPPNIWCLSAKAEIIAAGCSDGSVEIFSLRRRKRLAICKEDTSAVTSIRVSSRSSVVCGRKNGLLDFLEIVRTRFDSLKELDDLIQPESHMTELDESEGLCKCILKHRLRGHSHPVSSIETAGGKVITTCIDGSFKIYDGEDKVGVFSLQPQGVMVTSVYISTDDQFLALFGYEDGSLYTINLLSPRGIRPRKVARHRSAITAVRADGKYIYTLGIDNIVHISEEKDDDELVRTYKSEETIHAIEVLGQHALVVVTETSLILIDGTTGNEIEVITTRTRNPRFPSSLNICRVDRSMLSITRGKKLDLYRFPFLVDKSE